MFISLGDIKNKAYIKTYILDKKVTLKRQYNFEVKYLFAYIIKLILTKITATEFARFNVLFVFVVYMNLKCQ